MGNIWRRTHLLQDGGKGEGKGMIYILGKERLLRAREEERRYYKRPKGKKQTSESRYKWQSEGAYSHFENVPLVSL